MSDALFEARLTPYRSLSARGFRILMICVGTLCFTIGTVFWALGFWPVLGFMGLDVAIIYWAFRANYASGRAYEEVSISRDTVKLRQVSHHGNEMQHAFPQFGTRFEVDRHDEIGITQMRLANRGQAVTFGAMLNPRDKDSFADAFSAALSRAKR